MRIAICLSGAQRLANHALTFFARNLPAGITIDFFCYMWGGEWMTESELGEAIAERLDRVPDLLQVKIDTTFEPNLAFPHENFPETHKDNLMRMYYGIKKCNDMKVLFELEHKFKYDIVFRLRSDVAVLTQIELARFVPMIEDFIVFPENGHWRGGLNDQFAFSSSRNMDVYSSVYPFIPAHCAAGCVLHPETLLRFHLSKMKKDPVMVPLNTVLFRD